MTAMMDVLVSITQQASVPEAVATDKAKLVKP